MDNSLWHNLGLSLRKCFEFARLGAIEPGCGRDAFPAKAFANCAQHMGELAKGLTLLQNHLAHVERVRLAHADKPGGTHLLLDHPSLRTSWKSLQVAVAQSLDELVRALQVGDSHGGASDGGGHANMPEGPDSSRAAHSRESLHLLRALAEFERKADAVPAGESEPPAPQLPSR